MHGVKAFVLMWVLKSLLLNVSVALFYMYLCMDGFDFWGLGFFIVIIFKVGSDPYRTGEQGAHFC